MKIDPKLTLRKVANENMVMLLGNKPGDKSQMLVLNNSSALLWNELHGKDFSQEDIVRLLLNHYIVSEEQARTDARQWTESLRLHNAILD